MIVFSQTSAPDESSASALFKFLVAAHQLGDQHDRLRCGARDEHGHQNEAERARAARLPVDSPGSAIVFATSRVASSAGPAHFDSRL